VPLADELAFTRDYLALEQLRLAERLQVEWQIDDAAQSVPIPVLTLQPLLKNAIKHAFNPRAKSQAAPAGHGLAMRDGSPLLANRGAGKALRDDLKASGPYRNKPSRCASSAASARELTLSLR
jgi:hypothetical protein